MGTHHIPLTEAKQNLGELVKRTAYGGDRFVMEFRGKPRAALVSVEDLERLQNLDNEKISQKEVLERLSRLRKRVAARTGKVFDVVGDIEKMRQDRLDQLSGLR